MHQVPERIVHFLLAVASLGVVGTLLCAAGWYRQATASPLPEDLPPEVRQELAQELLQLSPGTHEATWYEPRIGYTLKREQQLSIWNDTFTSNRLGYRTGPEEKTPGTFRVVFVGDSWTYGQGVRASETFPAVFAELARGARGTSGPASALAIEAWTLALPGYNTFSELAALGFFFDRIRPDAVVVCPTMNDNHSLATVLPNGSLGRSLIDADAFGEAHTVTYHLRYVDSYRYHERWRASFSELRQSEERLAALGVPLLVYFVGPWNDAFAHALVQQAGLTSPYVITPSEYTSTEWQNPPPFRHATPAANRLFGRFVYQGVAELLGWAKLPPDAAAPELVLHRQPPAGENWIAASESLVRRSTRRSIPESFTPSRAAEVQIAGPMDPATGTMGRATTVLVERRPGARQLHVTVRRLRAIPSLYPLRVTLRIPAAGGGSEIEAVVPASGPEPRLSLAIPDDPSLGTVLDVVLVTERAAAQPEQLAGRALQILAIEQE